MVTESCDEHCYFYLPRKDCGGVQLRQTTAHLCHWKSKEAGGSEQNNLLIYYNFFGPWAWDACWFPLEIIVWL